MFLSRQILQSLYQVFFHLLCTCKILLLQEGRQYRGGYQGPGRGQWGASAYRGQAFQFGKMEAFWRWVVMVAQQRERTQCHQTAEEMVERINFMLRVLYRSYTCKYVYVNVYEHIHTHGLTAWAQQEHSATPEAPGCRLLGAHGPPSHELLLVLKGRDR